MFEGENCLKHLWHVSLTTVTVVYAISEQDAVVGEFFSANFPALRTLKKLVNVGESWFSHLKKLRNTRERIERGESAVSDQTLPTVNIITYCAPETAPVLLDVFKQCAKQDTCSDRARLCGCRIISYLLSI